MTTSQHVQEMSHGSAMTCTGKVSHQEGGQWTGGGAYIELLELREVLNDRDTNRRANGAHCEQDTVRNVLDWYGRSGDLPPEMVELRTTIATTHQFLVRTWIRHA